jgi:hypothetical protein
MPAWLSWGKALLLPLPPLEFWLVLRLLLLLRLLLVLRLLLLRWLPLLLRWLPLLLQLLLYLHL